MFQYELPRDIASNAESSRLAFMDADGSKPYDVPLAPAPTVTEPRYPEILLASFTRSEPSFTPDGKRLIYMRSSRRPSPSEEIWSAALDGSDDRLIGTGYAPRLSPDGRRIAYLQPWRVADDGLPVPQATWLMSARTGEPIRQLWPGPARSIDWSPNGRRIAFTVAPRGTDGNVYFRPADIYVMRADGTGLRRLTSTPRTSEVDVVWSPDGRRLAVVREIRRPAGDGESITQSIWTMRPDGTGEGRISGPWRGHDESATGRQMTLSWQPLPSRHNALTAAHEVFRSAPGRCPIRPASRVASIGTRASPRDPQTGRQSRVRSRGLQPVERRVAQLRFRAAAGDETASLTGAAARGSAGLLLSQQLSGAHGRPSDRRAAGSP